MIWKVFCEYYIEAETEKDAYNSVINEDDFLEKHVIVEKAVTIK